MWSMNVLILLLFCYTCLSTSNEDVYFESRNFFNVLHWVRPKNCSPGEDVLYTVRYKSDLNGQRFKVKKECQNITDLFCNLTMETPSEPDVHYIAQVIARGRHRTFYNTTSLRLNPIAVTTFGAADLTVEPALSSLQVHVAVPLGPNGISVADWMVRSKKGPFPVHVKYFLEITHPEWAEQKHSNTSGIFNINFTVNNVKYCGHVYYRPSTERGRPDSEKADFCVTLPGDPMMTLPWSIAGAVLLAVIATVSCVSCWIYAKGGRQSLPEKFMQKTPTNNWLQNHWMEPPVIDKASVSSPVVVGDGGYFPQEGSCSTWKDHSGLSSETSDTRQEEENSSSQSSIAYGTVAEQGAQAPSLVDDSNVYANRQMWNTNTPKLQEEEEEAVAPLLLHTTRDPNGQLLLPWLDPQFQVSADEALPSPTLHLSDLLDSEDEDECLLRLSSIDSGCDSSDLSPTQEDCSTHYFPNTAPISCEGRSHTPPGGYKQNQVTEMDSVQNTPRTDDE
ncbi:interferon lambda receptor 1 [Synchiropus splendidus]|uniref:interferon lambda receptor 1 n=1 Tax=Synchiropus splendidus TaxID=270530 RepID=UPI00237E1FDE|nr:interferon lambda receptor 1 [Synchiropus splendidus]